MSRINNLAATVVFGVLLAVSARAETWSADADGNWNSAANWSPAGVPNAVGATADLNVSGGISGTRTVTLDVDATVGVLNFNDTNAIPDGWIIGPDGSPGETLTFNDSSSPANITLSSGTTNDIAVPVQLNETETLIDIPSGNKLTISGAVSGSGRLTLYPNNAGQGVVRLAAANSFSGGIYIEGRQTVLELGHSNACGTGTLRVGYGDSCTLRNVAGSVLTMPNNFGNGGGSQTLYIDGGDFDLAGNIQFNNGQGYIHALAGATATFSGNIGCTGVRFWGPGTVEVVGTVSGSITHLNGGSRVGMGTIFGPDKTYLNGQGGMTLYAIGGPRVFSNPIALSGYGGNTFYFTGSHPITFEGAVSDESGGSNRGYTLNTADGLSVTFSGAIPGPLASSQNYYTKAGNGLLVFSGANTYTFRTYVDAGVLRATDGQGLPSDSYLRLSGGVLESAGTFSRSLAGQPGNGVTGAGQFRWNGSGGFSACGGSLTVDVNGGGADDLVWAGTANFLGSGQTLILGSEFADDTVTLVDNISLNGATRTVRVNDNSASASDKAVMAGAVTGSGGLSKTGDGLLMLTGTNNVTGDIGVSAGALGANGTIGGTLTIGDNAAYAVDAASANSLQVGTLVDLSSSLDTLAVTGIPSGRLVFMTYTGGALSGTFDSVDGLPPEWVDYSVAGEIALREPPPQGTLVLVM